MDNLYKKLRDYSRSDYYGFHMPGHKRRGILTGCDLPYSIDITEIEGFDDLHHARGILKEAEERAAALYHSLETHYLINGSTTGILSAVMGCTAKGDRILMARNCHKSVYHAVLMHELRPVYIYPEFYADVELNGPVKPKDIENALDKYEDIKAVVITSPTYDGVISDIKSIAAVVHRKGIPLIVDEAHGAHLGFHPYFAKNSVSLGADVVIHSLHKTLPALTQTALIHINKNKNLKENLDISGEITQYLHMLQTSSPSYVLMAGIDECSEMMSYGGHMYLDKYAVLLQQTRESLQKLNCLKLLETELYDKSKIVISVKGTGITGRQLYMTLLERYHLQMEMAAGSYVIAMTSMADTKEGMKRLTDALLEIDAGLSSEKKLSVEFLLPPLRQIYTSAETKEAVGRGSGRRTQSLEWGKSVGKVSSEYAYVYPPGIPLIVPGEEISEEAAALLEKYRDQGFSVEGMKEEGKIEVLING